MRFLLDAMLPPGIADDLLARDHDVTTPVRLGAADMPDDDVPLETAVAQDRVIITENARDFAHVSTCPVLFVQKRWWPPATLRSGLTNAIDRWAAANAEPGNWAQWLPAELR